MADIEQVFESAYAKAKADLLKEYNVAADTFQQTAHAVTGIAPQIKKIVSQTASGDIQDALPSTEELMNTIKNLYSEIETLKTQGAAAAGQLASNVIRDFTQGGEPIAHNLHLDNGNVIQGFSGIATHVANEDGTVSRVIAAYPVNPTTPKV